MKIRLLSCFLLVLLVINLIYAGNPLGNVDDKVKKVENVRDNVQELGQKTTDKRFWNEKWEYIGKEFPKLLLKNSFVKVIDSFLTKFTLVFRVLFGMDYSLSLILPFVMFFWFWFLIDLKGLIEVSGIIGEKFNFLASLLITIILAQLGFFENLVIFLGNLVFSPAHVWTRLVVFLIICFAFVFVKVGDRALAVYLAKRRKKIRRKKAEEVEESILEREKGRKEVSELADT